MAEDKTKKTIEISLEDLVPYIMRQGRALSEEVEKAKKALGVRYNEKNNVENMYRRFGDPCLVPEAFAREYLLILARQSTLPASVRYIVRDVCAAAYRQCYLDIVRKQDEKTARPL